MRHGHQPHQNVRSVGAHASESRAMADSAPSPSSFSVLKDDIGRQRRAHIKEKLVKLPSISSGSRSNSTSAEDSDDEAETIVFSGRKFDMLPDLDGNARPPIKRRFSPPKMPAPTKALPDVARSGRVEEAAITLPFPNLPIPKRISSESTTPRGKAERGDAVSGLYTVGAKGATLDSALDDIDLDGLLERLEREHRQGKGEGAKQSAPAKMEEPCTPEPVQVPQPQHESKAEHGKSEKQRRPSYLRFADTSPGFISHPIADLWDEVPKESNEPKEACECAWVFLHRWGTEKVIELFEALHRREATLSSIYTHTFEHEGVPPVLQGESGVVVKLAGLKGGLKERAIDSIIKRVDGRSSYQVFFQGRHESIVAMMESRGGGGESSGSRDVGAIAQADSYGGQHVHYKREFVQVAVAPHFHALAKVLRFLCLENAVHGSQDVISQDFPFLSLTAMRGPVTCNKDANAFVTSPTSVTTRGNALKREAIEETRKYALEQDAVLVLAFGMNASRHAEALLESAGTHCLGISTSVSRHFDDACFIQDDRRTAFAYEAQSFSMDFLKGGGLLKHASETLCIVDTSIASCNLVLLLRKLAKADFSVQEMVSVCLGAEPGQISLCLRVKKKDAIRELMYIVQQMRKISSDLEDQISVPTNDAELDELAAKVQRRGGGHSAFPRASLGKDRVTCLCVEAREGRAFFDLAECLNLTRTSGFTLHSAFLIQPSRSEHGRLEKLSEDRSKGPTNKKDMKTKRGYVVMVLERDMAVVRLQWVLDTPQGNKAIKSIKDVVHYVPSSTSECETVLNMLFR